MKVSIVTPSYNQGQFLKQCIDSVRNQTYRPIEHIIFDNCSTDETGSILEEYKENSQGIEVRAFVEPDSGQSNALNKGFRVATGSIVGWLNADDYYAKPIVHEAVRDFNVFQNHDIVYYDYYIINKQGKVVKTQIETEFDLNVLKYYGCNMPTTTMFFKKNVFDSGMFLNENLHYSMDAEFFIRLAKAGYSFKHIGKSLAYFRQHDGAKSIKDKHLHQIEGYRVRRNLCFEGCCESRALTMIKILRRIFYTKRVYLKVVAHIKNKCFRNKQTRLKKWF